MKLTLGSLSVYLLIMFIKRWRVKNKALGKADYSNFCSFVKLKHRIFQKFCIYQKYCVKIKFLCSQNTRSDSNFNQIYNYDHGMQGLSEKECFINSSISESNVIEIIIFISSNLSILSTFYESDGFSILLPSISQI